MSDSSIPDLNHTLNALHEVAKSIQAQIPPDITRNLHKSVEALYSSELNETLANLKDFSSKWSACFESSEYKRAAQALSEAYRAYLARSIKPAVPYMTEEQLETAEEILPEITETPDQPTQKPRRSLTVNDCLVILQILISIIAFLLTQLPDAQLEEIIEQNEVIIEQNDRLISQEDEKLLLLHQLTEAANNMGELICNFGEESDTTAEIIDDPAEITEDPDDGSDFEDHADDRSRLDQVDDLQDDDGSF